MNLQQPVWRTQWHRVNTTADCFAPERISQPPGFLQKAPDVSPVAEDPEISALLWKSLHKVHGKGKRDFWSCVGASGHCPNPQQGSFSLVSTQFACPASGANPGPSCPSPAGFVLHQSNPRVLCPKFSRKCTRFILSEHSEKLLVDILGREQTVEPGTQKDSLYFFLKIILLFFVTRLKLFDLYFTQNVYKMCGQIWWYIYFSNLITFTQIPFSKSQDFL